MPDRNAETVRPPAPTDLSLHELQRLADEMEADASRQLARAASLKRVIYKARNPHPELDGKQ